MILYMNVFAPLFCHIKFGGQGKLRYGCDPLSDDFLKGNFVNYLSILTLKV